MQFRVVPKNGDKLSVLGFGVMRLPQSRLGTVYEEKAVKLIRYAIDSGINYLDTAAPYHRGESERILGNALRDGYRERVKVATKLSSFMVNRPEDMPKILESQLKKLQTDHIDYYLLHALNAKSWDKLQKFEVLKFLEKAKKQGKIVNTGFSFHDSTATFKKIIDANDDWSMCQIQYNIIDENFQAGKEGLQYAASKKLAVMIMEPLRGGFLATKVPKEVEKIYAQTGKGRSPAEWGLRWVWNHPEVTVVLSGMSTQEQVEENVSACEDALPNSLSPQELTAIDKVAKCYKRLMKVPCTGCAYCMPCPNGVNIPGNFHVYNQYSMFGQKLYSRGVYAVLLMGVGNHAKEDASLCINCGACLQKCPQQINISQELKQVQNTLGDLTTKIMLPIIKHLNPLKTKPTKPKEENKENSNT
ncbi:MAG: aldo/keto reductase [Candidatus Bathyarchaeota archaeon]|nr:aldo/keto reductase [Candidatus Bathyarchaeota archaeon]